MKDVRDPSNPRVFKTGQLQVARFNSDGSATWFAVNPETPVYPFPPSHFSDADLGCPLELPHSDRQRTGGELFHEDAAIQAYRRRYTSLADFYSGEGEEALQGAILVDTHLAASAIGATPTVRLEDTKK